MKPKDAGSARALRDVDIGSLFDRGKTARRRVGAELDQYLVRCNLLSSNTLSLLSPSRPPK
jgi:hypothetical protein